MEQGSRRNTLNGKWDDIFTRRISGQDSYETGTHLGKFPRDIIDVLEIGP